MAQLREADKLAVADTRSLGESEQEAAGPKAEGSQLGCTREKQCILGWLEAGRCLRMGNKGPRHPAEVGCMAHTAVDPLGPLRKHAAAAQLLGLTFKLVGIKGHRWL